MKTRLIYTLSAEVLDLLFAVWTEEGTQLAFEFWVEEVYYPEWYADNMAVINEQEQYTTEVDLVISALRDGGHYSYALPVGIQAVRRNDRHTLHQLIDAAHDDTGLIEALEKETGENLSYLADEF